MTDANALDSDDLRNLGDFIERLNTLTEDTGVQLTTDTLWSDGEIVGYIDVIDGDYVYRRQP